MFGFKGKSDIDRIFQDLFGGTSKIKTNVTETDDFFVVKAELPGISKDKIQIEYKNEMLNIYVIDDIESKDVPDFRSLNIPSIDYKKSKATYFEGLLEITLPKKEIIDKSFLIPVE